MSNTDELSEVIDELEQVEQHREKERRVIARLLDEYLKKDRQVLAVRNEMGHALVNSGTPKLVPSYVASVTLRYLSQKENMKMGVEMPIMRESVNQEGRLVIDEHNAEEVKQRTPDWTRQPALTAYLVHDRHRKFGTLLAVLSPAWVDDPTHENWGHDGRALRNAAEFSALDSSGQVGLLDLNSVEVYALDGQHRLMAIRGLQDLLSGYLEFKRTGGDGTGKQISRDEFLAEFRATTSDILKILDEKVSVEFIPAVLKGETRTEASQRIRSVFVAINSYARRTDHGENALLDESDGFSLVARSVGVHHPLMKDSTGKSRVNWKNKQIPKKRSDWVFTLVHLTEMVKTYTNEVDKDTHDRWMPKFKGQVPIRPEKPEVEAVEKRFHKLLDYMRELPVFRALESGDELDDLRQFPADNPNGKGHLLTRPIGQVILVGAVGKVEKAGMNIDEVFRKLRKFDQNGGFQAHAVENIWYGVTYDPRRNTMRMTGMQLATDLLVYMLKGEEEEKRKELLQAVKEARRNDEGTHWKAFNGSDLPIDADEGELPRPIN